MDIQDTLALLTHLRAEFPVAPTSEPDVPILADNEAALGHEGSPVGVKPDPHKDSWLRVSVQAGEGDISAINHRKSRHQGFLEVLVHTPLGAGAERGLELANKVRNLFQARKIAGIHCRETTITALGASTDNLWFITGASTRFHFESTPS